MLVYAVYCSVSNLQHNNTTKGNDGKSEKKLTFWVELKLVSDFYQQKPKHGNIFGQ